MSEQRVWLVAGLGYGDEGKGSIVDYLARRENACAVIRYNGGAQAGHRVALGDGREHVFAQFGSGTFVPGVLTHLSRFMLVEPFGMMRENEHLKSLGVHDAFERTTIDEAAPVITPFHIAANRLLEISRGDTRHGSCGLGIGETIEDLAELGKDAFFMADLANVSLMRTKLRRIRDRKRDKVAPIPTSLPRTEEVLFNKTVLEDPEFLEAYISRYRAFAHQAPHIVSGDHLAELLMKKPVVFEGAQGMLLDNGYGFYPHVTKTDITFHNAETLLEESGYRGAVTKVGVIRGYFTRHGEGPFVTEDESLTSLLQDSGNETNLWQGKFRVGHFDVVAARYALEAIGGVDEIAVTNLDRMFGIPKVKICTGYQFTINTRLLGNNSMFEVDEKNVSVQIKIGPPANRSYQTVLTIELHEMAPIYLEYGRIANESQACLYALTLAQMIAGCYPSLLSFGPTPDDKINYEKP